VDVSAVDAALAHLGCDGRVLTVDPGTLADVLDSITVIGAATGRKSNAADIVAGLQGRLAEVADAVTGRSRPRVAVLEWTDPLFSAGHWVPDMVTAAGAICALGTAGGRSTPVSAEDLARSDPDIIVVAPCGYNLARSSELAADLVKSGVLPSGVPVWAVDADAAFVRPGPRLVDGIEALAAICHPDELPSRPEFAAAVRTTSAKTNPSFSTVSPTVTSTG
jgi:iron complex transport system substrate-binding protein